MSKKIILIIMASAVFLVSCGQQLNLDAEKAAAKTVVSQIWEAFENQDLDLLSKTFANDPNMIILGTDEAERWVGVEAFLEAEKRMFAAFKVEKIVTRDEVLAIHQSGEVAWFSTLADGDGTTKNGEQIQVRGARITGVVEKRDGRWRIVQYHSSIPVAGQNIEY